VLLDRPATAPAVPAALPDAGEAHRVAATRSHIFVDEGRDLADGGDLQRMGNVSTAHLVAGGSTLYVSPAQPPMADDLIEEKVSAFARKVVTLLANSAKEDMSLQAAELKKIVDSVTTMIELKIDREFVERMFNKFRVMLAEMNEKIENIQCSFLEWVTRDELELVLQRFAGVVGEVQDAAAATAKYECLLCGRKRSHVAGMTITGEIPPQPQSRPRTAVSIARSRKPKVAPLVNGKEPDVGPTQKARDVVQFLTFS
jgi:hypothetical protein